jgi:hypothetical protein
VSSCSRRARHLLDGLTVACLWAPTRAVVASTKPPVGEIVIPTGCENMPFPGADLRSAISNLLPAISAIDWRGHANDRFVLT